MGALALGPWKAGGSRTVDDWCPGENLILIASKPCNHLMLRSFKQNV